MATTLPTFAADMNTLSKMTLSIETETFNTISSSCALQISSINTSVKTPLILSHIKSLENEVTTGVSILNKLQNEGATSSTDTITSTIQSLTEKTANDGFIVMSGTNEEAENTIQTLATDLKVTFGIAFEKTEDLISILRNPSEEQKHESELLANLFTENIEPTTIPAFCQRIIDSFNSRIPSNSKSLCAIINREDVISQAIELLRNSYLIPIKLELESIDSFLKKEQARLQNNLNIIITKVGDILAKIRNEGGVQ